MNEHRLTHAKRSSGQRVMIYCHDGMGLGHLRRNLAICGGLVERFPHASFLIVTGTPFVPLFTLPKGVDYLKLPAISKTREGEYVCKHLHVDKENLLETRRNILVTTARDYRPDVLLVDKAPIGVCGEMLPTLEWLREHSPDTHVIFGMRDVEDDPAVVMREWSTSPAMRALEEYYDEIWVYGMKALFDVVDQYALSASIQKKLFYMGYVGRSPCGHGKLPKLGQREVLVTVGGGTDGEALIDLYLAGAGRRVAEVGGHSTIVGGPDLEFDSAQRLRGLAMGSPEMSWLDSTGCMSCELKRADLVVCMGGYNTMCEVISMAKPALVLPRTVPRREQLIRSCLWKNVGLIRSIDASGVTVESFAACVMEALLNPRTPDPSLLDMRAIDRIGARFGEYWKSNGSS